MEHTFTRCLSRHSKEIIEAAHKASTRKSYEYKWNKFLNYLQDHNIAQKDVNNTHVIEFITYLVQRSPLAPSSVRCYIAALSFYLQKQGKRSCFLDPLIKAYLKGYTHLNPPVQPPTPRWSLELVLSQLRGKPFEPMATTSLHLVTWKTAFLVAVTTARRVSEITALRVDEPYTKFFDDRVVLRPDISFLPKVVTSFHMNQDIILPAFHKNPQSDLERSLHMLDVRRALAFYVDRTAAFRKTNQLFVSYEGSRKGYSITAQRLSKWISSLIRLAYALAKKLPPLTVRTHLTRALSASSAFLQGVSVDDICKAATWSNTSTFANHYRVDNRHLPETAFGRAVLRSTIT